MDKYDTDKDILHVLNPLECSSEQCLHCKDGIKTITSTIRNTLLEINDIQERNRERRHRELVTLIEKYFHNDDLKAFTLANVNIENSEDSSIPSANRHSVENVEHPQVSKGNDALRIQQRKQSVNIRKRTNNTGTETKAKKKRTEALTNLKVEPILCDTPVKILKVKSNQRDELIAMREKMLAIQRRKMEDRERKKRENSAI